MRPPTNCLPEQSGQTRDVISSLTEILLQGFLFSHYLFPLCICVQIASAPTLVIKYNFGSMLKMFIGVQLTRNV